MLVDQKVKHNTGVHCSKAVYRLPAMPMKISAKPFIEELMSPKVILKLYEKARDGE